MFFGQNSEISAIVPCPVWRMPSSPLILAFCLSVAFASSCSLRAWMRKLPAAIKESSEDPRISKQKKFIFFEIIPDIYNAEKQQQLCFQGVFWIFQPCGIFKLEQVLDIQNWYSDSLEILKSQEKKNVARNSNHYHPVSLVPLSLHLSVTKKQMWIHQFSCLLSFSLISFKRWNS